MELAKSLNNTQLELFLVSSKITHLRKINTELLSSQTMASESRLLRYLPMKLHTYSRYDWVLQLIILPIYIGLLDWILIGITYWQHGSTFAIATLTTLLISFQIWFINNHIALRINARYTDPRTYFIRAVRRFLFTALNSMLHVSLLFGLFYLFRLPHFTPDLVRLGFALLYTMLIVFIIVAIYESMDSFGHWQKSREEVETLSKAQLQAELNALRQQVNPHFLFNSLNSLISLIEEDPQKAGAFAEELSTVYRYVLRSNEDSLVTLAQELHFIESYYHLLRTRHTQGLELQIHVDDSLRMHLLPPLTLQLLVENAVKHNVVLPDQPLCITLASQGQQLMISNNLQRKNTRVLSNGVGLKNILAKYQMMGSALPVVEDTGELFRITLPLLQPAQVLAK